MVVFKKLICIPPVLLFLTEMLHVATTQQCSGEATNSVSHMMLQRHIYKKMTVSLGYECLQLCNEDARCQSFNFAISQSVCEFNDRTKEASPEEFVPDSDRYYFGRDWNRGSLVNNKKSY